MVSFMVKLALNRICLEVLLFDRVRVRFLSDPDLSGTKHLDPVYKFFVRIRIVFFGSRSVQIYN